MTNSKKQGGPESRVLAVRSTSELIEIMQKEGDDAEREKILSEMTPAFRQKLKFFEDWFKKETVHALRRRYELGQAALEMYLDETQNKAKVYGRHAITRICKLLCWDDGVIRLALRFAQMYNPEDLEKLCSLVLPSGQPLSWSHLRCLLPVDDAGQRQELLDKTVTEGWSCTELAYEVKNKIDRPSNDQRGRPAKDKRIETNVIEQPSSSAVVQQQPPSAVVQDHPSIEQWDLLFNQVFAEPIRLLATQARQSFSDKSTEKSLQQAREIVTQLFRVADLALEEAKKAKQIVADLESKLKDDQVDCVSGKCKNRQKPDLMQVRRASS